MSLEDVIFDILSQWEGISGKPRFEIELLTREIAQAVHEQTLKDELYNQMELYHQMKVGSTEG